MVEHTPAGLPRPSLKKRILHGFGALCCLFAILLSSGLHTVALQSYGWATMYQAYRTALPASQAFERTFAGEELCGICVISQDLQDDLSESVTLSLSEAKPIPLSLSYPSDFLHPAPDSQGFGAEEVRHLSEITLVAESPPPKAV